MNHASVLPTARPVRGTPVHLMVTCLCDAFYANAAMAAVDVLEHLGWPVVFEETQTCCSQPAFNTGDFDSALKVARHTIAVFAKAQAVVVPSGSCAAMIRWGFPQLFRGQPDAAAAHHLAERTWEFAEFVTQVGGIAQWPGRYERRVALHRSCHLRELTTGDAPERLLRSIAGVTLGQLKTGEQCCGFGGTFSVAFPWTSNEMGTHKLADFAQSGADEIVSTDMGCVLHLGGLQRQQGTTIAGGSLPIKHLAEVLAAALKTEAPR